MIAYRETFDSVVVNQRELIGVDCTLVGMDDAAHDSLS
jgi:hypothetical protein